MRRPEIWKRILLKDSVADFGGNGVKLPVLMWLQQRCTATTELVFQFEGRLMDNSKKDVVMSTAIVAVAPAPAMQSLRIQMPANGSISSSTLAHAQLLSNLTSLQCSGIRSPVRSSDLNSLLTSLPALQHLALRVDRQEPPAGGPSVVCRNLTAISRCTGLTCLSISVSAENGRVLDWGGLSPAMMTALQRLKTLRLRNCLTQPVTDQITVLSGLTELGLCCELLQPDGEAAVVPQPLPLAVSAMTSLRCLDIMVSSVPPALTTLTGLDELTIRSHVIEDDNLCRLGLSDFMSLSHLQRLRKLHVNGCWVDEGENLKGLDACTALRALRIVDCCFGVLPQLRCFSHLTQLCVADHELDNVRLKSALLAMPQLRVLDISHGHYLSLGREQMLGLVGCCPNLQEVYVADVRRAAMHEVMLGEALLDVQREVPHVRLHLMGAPDYDFG